MSQLFSDKAALIYTRLLKRYGETGHIELRRITGATFDQSAGTRTGGSSADTSVFGVAGPIKRRVTENSRIREDQGVVVIDSAVEPLTSDLVLIDSKVHTIVDDGVMAFDIAGVVAGYEIIYQK